MEQESLREEAVRVGVSKSTIHRRRAAEEIGRVSKIEQSVSEILRRLDKQQDQQKSDEPLYVKEAGLVIGRPPSSYLRRVLVVGCTHFWPQFASVSQNIMTAVALHACKFDPHDIVHAGDGQEMGCLSPWASKRTKPTTIEEELACFHTCMDALTFPMQLARIRAKLHYCKGNHCNRLWKHDEAHPELNGKYTSQFDAILKDLGWTFTDFGEFYWLGGVGYTHVPIGFDGKPIYGDDAEMQVLAGTASDIVFADTHRHSVVKRQTLDGRMLTVATTGCLVPQPYVAKDVKYTPRRRMDRGVLEVLDRDGAIVSVRHLDVNMLLDRYGKEADEMTVARNGGPCRITTPPSAATIAAGERMFGAG